MVTRLDLREYSDTCICATYGDPSLSQTGWNYSFIANCAQNSVTGTILGTECSTLLGVQYAYSCYCRPRMSGDVGNIGDKVPGNAIFDTNDHCTVFRSLGRSSTGPTTPVPTSGVGINHPGGLAWIGLVIVGAMLRYKGVGI